LIRHGLIVSLTILAGPVFYDARVAAGQAKLDEVVQLDMAGSARRGPTDAAVSIVVFSDFECAACKQLAGVLHEIVHRYPDTVALTFRHFPLARHVNAPLAHEAALAAGMLGAFWSMHDSLFEDQSTLARPQLIQRAINIGLDVERFRTALETRKFRARVEQDRLEARALGVEQTPTLFVNGRKIIGSKSLSELQEVIDEELGGQAPFE
jgi:protein-disulfide isomerase